jgi:hypothetical protein
MISYYERLSAALLQIYHRWLQPTSLASFCTIQRAEYCLNLKNRDLLIKLTVVQHNSSVPVPEQIQDLHNLLVQLTFPF